MPLTVAISVPMIIFLLFIAPLWLILHYRSQRKAQTGISEHERQQLDDLLAKLDKMSDRVATLEEILDEKHDGWRRAAEQEGKL